MVLQLCYETMYRLRPGHYNNYNKYYKYKYKPHSILQEKQSKVQVWQLDKNHCFTVNREKGITHIYKYILHNAFVQFMLI